MIDEKNLSVEQAAAPTIGTAKAQSAAKNTLACDERSSNSKLFTSFKLSRELRTMIIEAELLIMKKYDTYSKGMNKELTQEAFEYYLDKSPYRKLKPDENTPKPLILRAAASCLYLCIKVKRDEMHSNFFGRNICEHEHTFEEEKDIDDFRIEFSDSISGFTKTHCEYLEELYPNAKDNAKLVKLAFSDVLMFAARLTGKFDAHLTSAGSKKWAMKLFHLDMLHFAEEKVLVDVFSRTASVAFASIDTFDEIYCGDKDKRFVNFFEVLRDYPVALVLRIKSIGFRFKKYVLTAGYSDDDIKLLGNTFFKENLLTRLNSDLHKARHSVIIDAAACLLFWIRFSYSGFGKDFNLEQARQFIHSLDTTCSDLLYTSMVLTDKENSRNIHKGIYKKTADGLAYESANEDKKNTTLICPISYEHWGFTKPIMKHRDNPNAVLILDMPYLRQFLLPCGDYKNSFTEKHARQMFELFKSARCKVILFHSENPDSEEMAKSYGFRLVGTYKQKEDSTEVTQVYSLNISPEEKFFDPKSHGDLY